MCIAKVFVIRDSEEKWFNIYYLCNYTDADIAEFANEELRPDDKMVRIKIKRCIYWPGRNQNRGKDVIKRPTSICRGDYNSVGIRKITQWQISQVLKWNHRNHMNQTDLKGN